MARSPRKKGRRGENLRGRRLPGAGRKPGTENKVTAFTRQFIQSFLDHNAEKVQELFDKVAKKQPAVAMRMLTDLCEFALPKLARTEMTMTIKEKPLEEYTDEELLALLAAKAAARQGPARESGKGTRLN